MLDSLRFLWSDEMMWQKINYIHNNPEARAYVDKPEHWRDASAWNFAGRDGLLPVCRAG